MKKVISLVLTLAVLASVICLPAMAAVNTHLHGDSKSELVEIVDAVNKKGLPVEVFFKDNTRPALTGALMAEAIRNAQKDEAKQAELKEDGVDVDALLKVDADALEKQDRLAAVDQRNMWAAMYPVYVTFALPDYHGNLYVFFKAAGKTDEDAWELVSFADLKDAAQFTSAFRGAGTYAIGIETE